MIRWWSPFFFFIYLSPYLIISYGFQSISSIMMTTAAVEASTLDRTDPRVRKLVYNMYRNVLGNYNDKANAMLDALPEHQVTKDQGINRQLSSILHQIGANDLVAGDMSAPLSPLHYSGGTQGVHPPPPPPPPPMVISGSIPAIRIKTELNEPREIPSTIQNAMATKDKKPFTYLPGGLDLSEIKSPRMQRRLERNAQTPPSPEQVPQKSPDYQQQQEVKINFEQKPACNVRSAAERPCLLPQVQHQPQLNKSPTPWMQKAAQIQPNPAPWTQNKKEYIDQVDKSEERVVPARVEINRQIPSQPLKNNINHLYDSEPIQGRSFKVLQKIAESKGGTQGVHPPPPPPPPPMVISGSIPAIRIKTEDDKSEERVVPARVEINRQIPSQPLKNNINLYDSEPIQGRSFKVLQKITEPKGVIYDGTQPYNSQSLPLSELRKLQLSDDDRSFMNRVKSQVDDDKFLHNETDPRYKGASIPSRSFRMLQTLTNSAPVPMDNNYKQSAPTNNYVSVEPIESKMYVPPSERPVGSEPHKYTGGSIPSRSFRMLQAMTGQNNGNLGESDF